MTSGALALSEIAIVSARRTRLVQMIQEGSSGAARALDLVSEATWFLSSVQVGITSIGILSGAIGGATLAGHVRQVLDERVPTLAAYAESLSLAVVVVIVTYVSLILGELVPKRLAMTDPEKTAAIVAGAMHVLAKIGRPIVYVLSASTSTVLRLLRVPEVKGAAVTGEEIKVLLEQERHGRCPGTRRARDDDEHAKRRRTARGRGADPAVRRRVSGCARFGRCKPRQNAAGDT
jgi:putative hemolysin